MLRLLFCRPLCLRPSFGGLVEASYRVMPKHVGKWDTNGGKSPLSPSSWLDLKEALETNRLLDPDIRVHGQTASDQEQYLDLTK